MRIEPFDPALHSVGVTQVMNAHDEEGTTADETARRWETWNPLAPRYRTVALDADGDLIGTAFLRRRLTMPPGTFLLDVAVLPGHCGRGVGSALYRDVLAQRLILGVTRVTTFVKESDVRSTEICEAHGFRLSRKLFESVLDVDGFKPPVEKPLPPGIGIKSLKELGGNTEENDRKLYAAHAASDQDEPGTVEYGLTDWPEFQRTVLQAEGFTPDGAFVAFEGDNWVGVHFVWPWDAPGEYDMNTDYTGVVRSHRGMGIATALKLKGIEFTRSLGRKKLLTHNDSTNQAMLHINKRLGFVPAEGVLLMSVNYDQEHD